MRTLQVVAVIATMMTSSRFASAALDHHCEFDPDLYDFNDPTPEYPWHESNIVIPVYTSSSHPPWTTIGISQAAFEYQLEKTLAIQNEQFGSTVRLRYIGSQAPSAGYIPGALLILGDSGCGNGYGYSDIVSKKVNGHVTWHAGQVFLSKYLGCPTSDPNNLIHWTTVEQQDTNQIDIEFVLLHEIGHAVWGFDHPHHEENPNCDDFGQYSYMFNHGDPGHPPAWRTIKNYEAEIVQYWYGSRSAESQIYHSHYDALNTWSTPQRATDIDNGCGSTGTCASGPGLMFRMGSMTQYRYEPDVRVHW